MVARFNDYISAMGEEARERLKLLGDVYNTLFLWFLRSLPIQDPQHVLDVAVVLVTRRCHWRRTFTRMLRLWVLILVKSKSPLQKNILQVVDNVTYHAMLAEDIGQLNQQFTASLY